MKGRLWALVVVGLTVTLGGCAGPWRAWSAAGFEQRYYGWKATYAEGQKTLLGDEWRLDNWEPDEYGGLRQKGYTVDLAPDRRYRNGVLEHTVYYLCDLKFTNTHNNGVLWVQTIGLSEADARKDLDVLLENYALPVTESQIVVPDEVVTRTLLGIGYVANRIASKTEINLGAQKALSAALDAQGVNLPGTTALRLVVTRFDYLKAAEDVFADCNGPGTSCRSQAKPPPVESALMVIGYANDTKHFEAGLPDLARFLERLSWAPPPTPARSSTTRAPPPGAAPKAAPASTPAEPPPSVPSSPPPAAPSNAPVTPS